MSDFIESKRLRAPDDLSVTQLVPRRALIVGSCLSEGWAQMMMSLSEPCESDIYLLGQDLPEKPSLDLDCYDFQIVQLALRFVLPDGAFARLVQTDYSGHEELFAHAVNATRRFLSSSMRWNRQSGLLTFVFPFVVPLQNPVGRLMPRYNISNPVYFVEKLNEVLAQEIQVYRNTYLFDLNEIYSFYGRRFVQEDFFMAINHAGLMSDFDYEHDINRLEPPKRASELFETDIWLIFRSCWQELISMYRSVRQVDPVKLVVVDLDDTLWRGLIAETDVGEFPTSEGWPRGLWEALLFLKRRGILLAIISKNEESRVEAMWHSILANQLTLDDFALRRINWLPKPENLLFILTSLNLLPQNVVYVDDNPAERAAVKAVFPEIRVLGGTPLNWRRVLLWSSETQAPTITAEASSRNEMIRGQLLREEQRKNLQHVDFLSTLNVRLKTYEVANVDDLRFSRALELVNRTNQFNTTGARWTLQECMAAFSAGAIFLVFEAADIYTEYGLIAVLILQGQRIRQFVMSCRVMGLDVEVAAIANANEVCSARGASELLADLVKTDRNLPCLDVFARCGFEALDGLLRRATTPSLIIPSHITLLRSGSSAAEDAAPATSGSPFRADKSDRTTSLATQNRADALAEHHTRSQASSTPAVSPGASQLIEEIVFGHAGGNETERLRGGWARPEPHHRWSIGQSSGIELCCPSSGNLLLEFDVWPFLRPPTVSSQRLFVEIDDTPVASLLITEGRCYSVRVTALLRRDQTTLLLKFSHPDAASPADFGPSDDKRLLAVCFRRLRVFSTRD